MKIKDQVIVAFLVSVGVFSTVQATQYVNTLSVKNKKDLFSTCISAGDNVVVAEASGNPVAEGHHGG